MRIFHEQTYQSICKKSSTHWSSVPEVILFYQVRLIRNQVNGTLYIDNKEIKSGQADGKSSSIDGIEKFYLGGIPEQLKTRRIPVSRYITIILIKYITLLT